VLLDQGSLILVKVFEDVMVVQEIFVAGSWWLRRFTIVVI
jgi:hypothetical protein